MSEQQELYDESMSCCLANAHKNPLALWRTLERTHAGQFCPPELVERFAQELNRKSDAVEALATLVREIRSARDGMGVAEALLLAPGLHRAGQFLDQVGCNKTDLLA